MIMKKTFSVGSRQSELAKCQSSLVIEALSEAAARESQLMEFQLETIPVTGDIRRDAMNLNVQDKKQWVIELEDRILSKEIDCAIHSAKDVPLTIEKGTSLITVLRRGVSGDVLLYNSQSQTQCPGVPLPMLKPGAVVGTSSKRRRSQILRLRPDLTVTILRGNITTRVEKLRMTSDYDAIILAAAGLERLSIAKDLTWYQFSNLEILPAVGQGTLLAQYRSDDIVTRNLLAGITDPETEAEYQAERNCVNYLGADCHSNLGVFASITNGILHISGRVLSDNGQECVEAHIDRPFEFADAGEHVEFEKLSAFQSVTSELGRELAKELLRCGASPLI